MKRSVSGFTLIEILVVVTILSILSAVLYANFNEAKQQSRDTERQGDLRTLQTAIELFKNEHGHYPSGCNASGTWSGQTGSGYNCSSGNQYIVNLAPKYIPALPTDPKLNPAAAQSGYMYVVNTEGTVYKLMAKNTVEIDKVTDKNHEFESCDVTNNSTGVCDSSYGGNSNSLNNWCGVSSLQFQTSYAVWGGYPYEPFPNIPARSEEQLERILCDIP